MPSRRVLALLSLALLACTEEAPHRITAAPAHAAEPSPPAPSEEMPSPHDVTFTTSDGVTIAGTLHRSARVDAPAVILVHQVGSTRAEWTPLLERLHVAPAFTTLAIDLRGHGASTHGPSGALDWQSLDDAQWAATRLDVLAAVAYLAGPDSGVAPAAIAAVGSSIGSSAVIAAAAEEPRLGTLVTLSPGRAYHGFDAITPAMQLESRAIFALAARDEEDATETAEAYGRLTGVPPLLVDGGAHGVLLFGVFPAALDQVEDFLRERLTWPRVTPRQPSVVVEAPPVTSTGTPVAH